MNIQRIIDIDERLYDYERPRELTQRTEHLRKSMEKNALVSIASNTT